LAGRFFCWPNRKQSNSFDDANIGKYRHHMMTTISLKLFDPYSIVNESSDVLAHCPYSKDQGIYLWCVKTNADIYKPTYIGETGNSFYQRTKEHLIQTFGGNYLICNAESLRQDQIVIEWNGLWRKGTRNKLPEFFQTCETLISKIKDYVAVQQLFLIPFVKETKLRRRIESSLAHVFMSSHEASNLMPHDIRYLKPNAKHKLIDVIFEQHELIQGFPSQIKA